MKKTLMAIIILLVGCVSLPEDIAPVDQFQLERYLGKWYEIARLNHSFERGLTSVTAHYTLRPDGGVRVLNRGYSAEKKIWKEAEGKAYFIDSPDQGLLKVSFFGPFYGSYVIFELDREQYSYALVCGPDRSYLWLLARSPKLSEEIKKRLIAKAAAFGFDTNQLIFVHHDES